MEEYVILVDQNDNPIGKEDKVKCHLPNGILHRAFTALIFNGEGKLLLTKRSDKQNALARLLGWNCCKPPQRIGNLCIIC